jgi:toxin ParE1/3/4
LALFPDLGERRDDLAASLRCFAVGGYAIVYRPSGAGIEIVRVVSGARDIEALFDTGL